MEGLCDAVGWVVWDYGCVGRLGILGSGRAEGGEETGKLKGRRYFESLYGKAGHGVMNLAGFAVYSKYL